MVDTSSARPIPTKIFFPPFDEEILRGVNNQKFKQKFYAGHKLIVYSKDLLIICYTDAFYFEEAVFNFYHVCKSFRKLLIQNFKIVEKLGIKIPSTDIFPCQQNNPNIIDYFIKSSCSRIVINIVFDNEMIDQTKISDAISF